MSITFCNLRVSFAANFRTQKFPVITKIHLEKFYCVTEKCFMKIQNKLQTLDPDLEEQSDLGLQCLPWDIRPKTLDRNVISFLLQTLTIPVVERLQYRDHAA